MSVNCETPSIAAAAAQEAAAEDEHPGARDLRPEPFEQHGIRAAERQPGPARVEALGQVDREPDREAEHSADHHGAGESRVAAGGADDQDDRRDGHREQHPQVAAAGRLGPDDGGGGGVADLARVVGGVHGDAVEVEELRDPEADRGGEPDERDGREGGDVPTHPPGGGAGDGSASLRGPAHPDRAQLGEQRDQRREQLDDEHQGPGDAGGDPTREAANRREYGLEPARLGAPSP
jgi:hypothetical protein